MKSGGSARFAIVPALIIGLFAQSALFALRPILSYRAIDLGAGAAEIGVLTASFAILPIFLAVPIGRLVDTYGGRRFAIFGALTMVIAGVGFFAANSYLLLILLNLTTGLGQLSLVLAVQWSIGALVADRDRGYARFSLMTSLGQAAGPIVGTWMGAVAAEAGLGFFSGAFGFCLMSQLVVMGATWWLPRPAQIVPKGERGQRVPLLGMLGVRGMRTAVFSSFVTLVTIDLLTSYLPLWAEEKGISVVAVGWLLALRGAASLVSRIGLPWLLMRFGHASLAGVATFATGVAMLALNFADLGFAFVIMATIGTTLGLMQPLTMSWVVGLAPHGTIAAALGLRLSANRLGQVVVPLAAAGITLVVSSPVAVVFTMVSGMLLASTAVSTSLRRSS